MRRSCLDVLLAALVVAPLSTASAQVAPAWSPASAPAANARVDSLLARMTLAEKLGFLHGDHDPDPAVGNNSAGYMPGVPRLGVPPLRFTDGPAGIRTSLPATALPAPVALAATFDTSLARRFGDVMGREGVARNQDVLLSPMVNIVRVPQGGRNFETLGEDPLLAARIVASEIRGIEGAGMIATVKHYAANNFEHERQRVDVTVDARTLHEVYLPAFEAAARAGVGSVMCSYNKVNGTHACGNRMLLTDELRTRFGFGGWVMTDWFATHDVSSLDAGLDQEMPGFATGPDGSAFGEQMRAAVEAGRVSQASVDRAVRRILVQMDRVGMLNGAPRARPAIDSAAGAAVAREVALRGAVLLRNERATLPLSRGDLATTVVIGPTAKVALIGGGGSAAVIPFHTVTALAALERRAGRSLRWLPGVDLEGVAVPASVLGAPKGRGLTRVAGAPAVSFAGGPPPGPPALPPADAPPPQQDAQVDFAGARALPTGTSWTWSGTITAPSTGEYDLMLQTDGGAGTLTVADSLRARTGILFGGGSLLKTADGLTSSAATLRLVAGQAVPIRVTIDGRPSPFTGMGFGGGPRPVQVRLAWSTPQRRQAFVDDAARAARGASHVLVFAHDEGTEGADRPSLALPARQDAMVDAVARANAHTIVVLQTGSAVTMPWLERVGAVLEMWYPGEDGGEATAALVTGKESPSGRLAVTFPRREADAPTADPARYRGDPLRADYSEGVLVGYRWYDTRNVAPLFAFGHGLSYATFEYSDLAVRSADDGWDVSFRVRNAGTMRAAEVPQLYVAAPAQAPVPMAARQLAGFARVLLAPGESRAVTIHVEPRALSYWSIARDDWERVLGARELTVGGSSRDVRLRGKIE